MFLFTKRKSKIKKKPAKIFKPPSKKYFIFTLTTIIQILFIFLFISLIFSLFTSSFFKVKFIDCYIETLICTEDEEDLFAGSLGKNIFLLKTKEMEDLAKLSELSIKNVNIAKKLPNRLSVKLDKRKPFAILLTTKGIFLVDDQGLAFQEPRDEKQRLPTVELLDNESAALGESVGHQTQKALDLVKILDDIFVPFDKIVIGKDKTLTLQYSGYEAIFSQEKDFFKQAVSLQLILQSSKINKKLTKIDLRFDKPVVIYND